MFKEPNPENWRNSPDYLEAIAYTPKPQTFEITTGLAETEITKNFPAFDFQSIRPVFESAGNAAFVVNEKYIFRFPKSDRGARMFPMETALLPQIRDIVSLPIPNPQYIGVSQNGLPFMGYEGIPGEDMGPPDVYDEMGIIKTHLAKQLADFFNQVHSFPVDTARELGVPERNLAGKYHGELERAREILYPFVQRERPSYATRYEDFIEQRFAEYLSTPRNFEYAPTFLHGDLESEHIMYSQIEDKIMGIIDFGGVEISDPDVDLWRPYFHYGRKFIDEILRFYPPPADSEFLFEKMNFYIDAQLVHRLVRNILNKSKTVPRRLDIFQEAVLDGKRNFR